jgi:hypothetical protein
MRLHCKRHFQNSIWSEAEHRLTVHGVMMFVCWAVLFPSGVFIARFLRYHKKLLRWWFHLHLLTQYLGVLFLLTGFTLAVEAVAYLGQSHFNNTHAILGMVTFCLGVLVPAFGQVAAMFWTATASESVCSIFGTRLFPEGVCHFACSHVLVFSCSIANSNCNMRLNVYVYVSGQYRCIMSRATFRLCFRL